METAEAIELIKFRAIEALDMPPPEDWNFHETERAMYALRNALNDILKVIEESAQSPKVANPESFGNWLEANGGTKPGSERRVR